jgi:hypothetical protein
VVTWTYDDGNGNTETQTQNVVIDDVTAPIVNCVEDQTINLNANETSYIVQGAEFNPDQAIDNCEVASTENDFNNSNTLSGAELPVGTTTVVWTITDEAGNTAECSFDITVKKYTTVSEIVSSEVLVYPNPTSGIINLDFSEIKVQKLFVSDMTGKTLISKQAINQKELIDLSNYPSGIYFINIITNNKVFTTKLVKK